ncbi:MAG: hypothetical protein VKL59_13180 [Nostocaceae cyanobacterium]|nr:hypothetical protein [Nostocaceae cyanobacterium]
MQAKEIKDRLKLLIKKASITDPHLARRLDEINRWVKDVKPGSLTAKKFVLLFLEQTIRDAEVWLDIKALTSVEEQQAYYKHMTPTEKYWYCELLSHWLSQDDPKFYIWRQKLMAGEFTQSDADLIASIANHIKQRSGTIVKRYIADLSMATDIIVSNREQKALCIQLTSVADEFSQQKYKDWENTLRFWIIDRGLFLSYNPSTNDFVNQIVNVTLYNSDKFPAGRYLKFSL